MSFSNFLENEISIKIEVVSFDVRKGEYPKDLSKFSGYLTTGSSHSVYDDLPWLQDLKQFIVRLYKEEHKFFGVCFGHQLSIIKPKFVEVLNQVQELNYVDFEQPSQAPLAQFGLERSTLNRTVVGSSPT